MPNKPAKKKTAAKSTKTKSATPKSAKLESFLKSIHDAYPSDSVAPGLVLSYIAINPLPFYASVTRCRGQKRESVLSCSCGSLLEALNELAAGWKTHLDLINQKDQPITKI